MLKWFCRWQEIIEVLDAIPDTVNSSEELERLKESNEAVRKAFAQAEAIQQTVDQGTSPIMQPPGQLVEIEGPHGNLSLHAILKGNRVSEKDPVVIFESGLGCFSPDWQFVQDGLPDKKNDFLELRPIRSGLERP